MRNKLFITVTLVFFVFMIDSASFSSVRSRHSRFSRRIHYLRRCRFCNNASLFIFGSCFHFVFLLPCILRSHRWFCGIIPHIKVLTQYLSILLAGVFIFYVLSNVYKKKPQSHLSNLLLLLEIILSIKGRFTVVSAQGTGY